MPDKSQNSQYAGLHSEKRSQNSNPGILLLQMVPFFQGGTILVPLGVLIFLNNHVYGLFRY